MKLLLPTLKYSSWDQKNISLLLIILILTWALGLPLQINNVNAASLTNISDTISDSDMNSVSNHTIQFNTSPTGELTDGENLTITFESGFVIPDALDFTDIDMRVGGAEQTLASSASAGQWGVSVATTTRVITITSASTTEAIGSGTTVIIEIGTNATSGAIGNQQITNPGTSKSYTVDIGGTMDDSGEMRVAIINDVVMSAAVGTSFTFTISPVDAGVSINGEGVTTFATSTATSMGFGALEVDTPKVMAQQLSVVTNAKTGFTVTVQQSQNLTSASADIDLFVDGNATSTPEAWVAPTGTAGQENTYGHYGITSEDISLSGGDEFGTAFYAGNLDTPREVFYHTSIANGLIPNEGMTRVAIKIEINSLQEAGSDYSNILTYVATPVF